MKLSRESILIAIIGTIDLVTTVLWVQYHGAQEANPVFAHYLAMGVGWFAMMKLVMLAGPIYLLEWAKVRRPRFTMRASQVAIAAYCGMYLIGIVRLNPGLLRPHAASADMIPSTVAFRVRHRHPKPSRSNAQKLPFTVAANTAL